MKRFILALPILFIATFCQADVVNIDMTGWTSKQKSQLQAMANNVLFNNSVTFDSIHGNHMTGDVTVINPSTSISSFLTKANIEAEYVLWKAIYDAAVIAAETENQGYENEIAGSAITNKSLDELDTWIDTNVDAIGNLADAKVFLKDVLKKLARFLKAQHPNK